MLKTKPETVPNLTVGDRKWKDLPSHDPLAEYEGEDLSEFGKLISCPLCNKPDRVYHWNWSALKCHSCDQEVPKQEWLVGLGPYRERPKLTIAEASAWLGERGVFISTRDIKVRGRWILVLDREYPEEIDCYKYRSAIHAEVFGEIKYTDSPFVPDNEERTARALAKVELDELNYSLSNGEMWQPDGPLYLIATSGDYAAGGMGEVNAVLPFRKKHYGLVETFVKAQLAWRTALTFDKDRTIIRPLTDAHMVAEHALLNAGVFHHKYHCRTSWEIVHPEELHIRARYKPFFFDYPRRNDDD